MSRRLSSSAPHVTNLPSTGPGRASAAICITALNTQVDALPYIPRHQCISGHGFPGRALFMYGLTCLKADHGASAYGSPLPEGGNRW